MSWYIPERTSNNSLARSSFTREAPKKRNRKNIVLFTLLLFVASFILSGYAWLNKAVVLKVDARETQDATLATTVSDFLKEKGIKLHTADKVTPSLNTELKEGTTIEIVRSFSVILDDGGKKQEIKTISVTVEEFLAKNNISLNKIDKVTPGLSTKTYKDMVVKIVRYEIKSTTKVINVPFSREIQKDNKMMAGQKSIAHRGVNGVSQQVIEVLYENGKVKTTRIVKTKVIKAPQKEIIKVGARARLSRGGQDYNYSRMLIMNSSGYTHTGRRTATGIQPRYGVVAVDTSVIPMGTKLYIEGYGYATAADTGSAINGNDIDLFFNSFTQCMLWGRRSVKVYIIN
jgi:uncharacterized protein YabE (DUF348 family)